jgi:methylglutaconyl-CoA hydratase
VLTGERFDAEQAREYGVLHEVVAADALDAAVGRVVADLLAGGPGAQAAVKDLILDIDGATLEPGLAEDCARRLAEIRCSAEGREGVAAFLEKRRPNWAAE